MARNTSGTAQTQGFAPEEEQASREIDAIPFESIKFEKIEFSELGNRLPTGFFLHGERLDKYTLEPYKTKHDRVLGQYIKNSRNRLIPVMGRFFPEIVATIGGYPVKDLASKLSTSPHRLFESMYLGDALTLLLGIRHESIGDEVAISCVCPNCNTKNDDNPKKGRPFHDMSTITVKAFANLTSKPIVAVTLKDGFEVFGDRVMTLHMQPLKLYQAENIAKSEGTPEDLVMLYSMVCGIPEAEAYKNVAGQVFSDELYDELTKDDLKIVRKALKALQIGPEMSVDMECYSCGFQWEESIAWGRLREFLFVSPDTDDE